MITKVVCLNLKRARVTKIEIHESVKKYSKHKIKLNDNSI